MTWNDIFLIFLAIFTMINLVKLWLAGKEVEDTTIRILEIEAEAKEAWREIGDNLQCLGNILLYGHDVQDAIYEIIKEVIEDEERMLPM